MASHRNGLDGITFPDFFSALLWKQDPDWKNLVFTTLEGLRYQNLHHVHIFSVCSFPICSNGGHKGSSPEVVAMSYASVVTYRPPPSG
ncbi:hypothetical protein GQ600_15516 [Phytophthora cactorum]|nr:hypothetical protein GQ600_15516 [Phytophthora cactorum]